MKLLIVGLCNPGLLSHTRHSIGGSKLNLQWTASRALSGDTAEDSASGVVYLRPSTFMNRSGVSVAAALRHYGVTHRNMLVLHDDLDRDLGKISVKEGGSASGHNGLKSIIQQTKTDSFPRLRLGIGRPDSQADVPTYVLRPFEPAETRELHQSVMPRVEAMVAQWIQARLAEIGSK